MHMITSIKHTSKCTCMYNQPVRSFLAYYSKGTFAVLHLRGKGHILLSKWEPGNLLNRQCIDVKLFYFLTILVIARKIHIYICSEKNHKCPTPRPYILSSPKKSLQLWGLSWPTDYTDSKICNLIDL